MPYVTNYSRLDVVIIMIVRLKLVYTPDAPQLRLVTKLCPRVADHVYFEIRINIYVHILSAYSRGPRAQSVRRNNYPPLRILTLMPPCRDFSPHRFCFKGAAPGLWQTSKVVGHRAR